MDFKLTQYSKASGCGCKIAPAVLEEILSGCKTGTDYDKLLVGNESGDDAAVYELDADNCIVSTTDFFTPIVDNPHDFGKISACNALSDVYAMGGKPLMAVAILGWPLDKIPASVAREVIRGAQEMCNQAGIPLAGGHSVDTQEPLFGLAVTGLVSKNNLKQNHTVKENDLLFLSKPLGIGILSTALKRGLIGDAGYQTLLAETTQLNKIGEKLGASAFVHAMTDVTGFGLIGHLLEMVENTPYTALLEKAQIPIMETAQAFASQFVFPDNTTRNYNAQIHKVEGLTGLDFLWFCDPQTSGGLLFSVGQEFEADVEALLKAENQFYAKIGRVVAKQEKAVVLV